MLSTRPIVPWVPSKSEVLDAILGILRPRRGDVFLDLGCGDARIAAAVAKRFSVYSICVELKDRLLEKAKRRVSEEGVGHLVEVVQSDLYEYPLKGVNIIYMYLLTSANYALRERLEKELDPGTVIISLDFPIPGWQPVCVLQLPCSWQRYLYIYVKGYSDTKAGDPLKLLGGRIDEDLLAGCRGGYTSFP